MSTSNSIQATLVDQNTLKGILPETSASGVFFEDGESLQQKFNNDALIAGGLESLLENIQCVSPTVTVESKDDVIRLAITDINGVSFTPNLKGRDGKSIYDIAVETGFRGTKEEWINSIRNSSAYELAVEQGYKGTVEEWLKSLKGKDSYDHAVENGFTGSVQDWLESLKGKDAYHLAKEYGFIGTETDWLRSLKGENGPSAYDVAVEYGFKGSPERWISTLKGRDGASAYDVAVEYGYEGSVEEWLESLKGGSFVGADGKDGKDGKDGADGKSAYEVWKDYTNQPDATEEDFFEAIKGEDGVIGKDGADGKSAYEIAKELGYEGSEEEWIESLKPENYIQVTGVKGSAESEYRSGEIEIAKEHILGLENVENTLDKDKNVAHAISSDIAGVLSTARQFIIEGALESAATFDGSADVTFVVSSVKADKLDGIIPIENLPISGVLATLEETLAKKVEMTNVPVAGAITVAVQNGYIESSGVKLNELLNSFTGETALIPVNVTIEAKNYGDTIVKIPEALVGGLTFNVYHNGSLLVEGLHYNINETVIDLIGFTTYEGDLFTFTSYAGGNGSFEITPAMLPIATEDSVGVVKSTTNVSNYISIDEEGRMYVEKINFNTVVTDPDSQEEIILMSGSSI